MYSWSSQNYFIILSYSKSLIALGSLFITLSGARRTYIFMMSISRRRKRLRFTMTFWFQSFAELLLPMRAKYFASEVVTKTTSVAIGCSSTTIISKSSSTRVHYSSEDQTLQLFTLREASYSSLVEMMRRASTQLVRSTIFKTTLGAESQILMWLGTQPPPASSTINTSTCSQVGPSSTKRRSQTP